MRHRHPSRYLFGGLAIIMLGAVGLFGIKTVVFQQLLANHEQRLLVVALLIVIGVASASYSFWLASERSASGGSNVPEKFLKYLSRKQGMTDKDIATSIWGQTLSFLIILCVLLLTFAIILLVLRAFKFAT